MKVLIAREKIMLIPEEILEEAFIEDTLGLKEHQAKIYLTRKNIKNSVGPNAFILESNKK